MKSTRKEQSITIEGKNYFSEDIHRLAAKLTADKPSIMRDLYLFLDEWFSESPLMKVHTSGSTGTPKELTVGKEQMMQSARMTCEVLHLTQGDTALLCMPLQYIAGKMMVVRALVAGLNLIVRTPTGHPLANVSEEIRFAAMVPLQVYNSIDVPEEWKRLNHIGILLIGGGMINPYYLVKLRTMPGEIYATYGMTETLSHIALCRLNGNQTDAITYYPLPGVKISLSADDTLVIDAPRVCDHQLTTNDIVSIDSEGGFIVLGRTDNTINSGGIKMQPEKMELWLQDALPMPFAFTSMPHDHLGEVAVLLVEGSVSIERIRILVEAHLPDNCRGCKWIVPIEKLPLTGSGKIDRAACKKLAHQFYEQSNLIV
ncbi:MAG: AMP-binding protein [Bacteroides sp.]